MTCVSQVSELIPQVEAQEGLGLGRVSIVFHISHNITIQGRGERRGFDDARGELFFEVLRVLHQRQPKAFLLENAPGISMDRRDDSLLN